MGDVVNSDWLTSHHVGVSLAVTVTHASEVIVDWVVRYRIGRSVGSSEGCELGIIEML